MPSILHKQHGMNIIGQGAKIFLFTLPFILAALYLHFRYPEVAALPTWLNWLRVLGWIWLIPGILLWSTAVLQLLSGFSQGKLITTGAYGIVRNPIYSCVIWFVLPAVSLITQTWVYLAVAVFLYIGVVLFIKQEEFQLLKAFGQEYADYLKKVHRVIPFLKP